MQKPEVFMTIKSNGIFTNTIPGIKKRSHPYHNNLYNKSRDQRKPEPL